MTQAGASTETTYTYDGLSLLSLDSARSDGATWTITYVYDEAGRPWAATYSEASETVLFHLITTDRGDVVELTDEGGEAFATYRYDAWGNPVAAETKTRGLPWSLSAELAARIAERQPLRYAGCAYDAHSALYYLSQRYYDPATFQFLTKDPARDDGEESAYQYCGGDPVGKVDPTGLWWTWSRLQLRRKTAFSLTVLRNFPKTIWVASVGVAESQGLSPVAIVAANVVQGLSAYADKKMATVHGIRGLPTVWKGGDVIVSQAADYWWRVTGTQNGKRRTMRLSLRYFVYRNGKLLNTAYGTVYGRTDEWARGSGGAWLRAKPALWSYPPMRTW